MNDIRKLLDIINETTVGATASGAVSTVEQSMHTQRRVEEDYTEESSDKPQMPQILEYGNWENSALTTSKKLKKSRKKASKIVKSVYGEDMPGEKVAVSESVVDESGLQAYLGNKKYGKEGMDALRSAGREGASKEKMAKLRAKYDKPDEENVAEGVSAQDKNISVGDYVQTAAGVEGVVKHISPDGKKLTIWNRKRQADHRVDISKAEKIPGIARRKMAEQGVAEGSEQSAYIKYNQGYNDAKNSKPSIHKTLTGNDRHNYVMGYKDGLTDRKKPKEQGVAVSKDSKNK